MRSIFARIRYPLLTLAALGLFACSHPPQTDEKVIVLAIDGMDPRIVQSMIDQGRLPHFKKLAEMGGFKNLWSSVPPQSPVAWANFITGQDPGGHAIFDFIHRDPDNYLPYLSLTETLPPRRQIKAGSYIIPVSGGEVKLLREGRAFWEYLDEAGIPATLFKIPSNYPPVEAGAGSVSGMGTPDLMGTYGTYQYFTTDRSDIPDDYSGARLTLVDVVDGAVREAIEGPPNTYLEGNPILEVPFTAWLDPEEPVIRIDLPGEEIVLREGEWSDWVVLSFKPLPVVPAMTGIVRFFARQVRPYFKLYVTPVNINPADPALPIDYPSGTAARIAREAGLYYTQGMPEDTKALTNQSLSIDEFYQLSRMILEERHRLFHHLFDRFEEGLFFFYYCSIDQGTHIFWHLRDENHPLYDPEARQRLGDVIEELYEDMDPIVARILDRLDEDTTLIIMSDHGFSPLYRNFQLNAWLEREGYLTLRRGRRSGSLLMGDIDWSRTRAYALGLNALYVNLRGREGSGLVNPGLDRDRLVEELVEKLEALRDPVTGNSVVKRAHPREKVYSGPYAERAPDILVGYDWGYRTAWESALGDIVAGDLVTDCEDLWSGDHCGATEIVPGILFSNRPLLLDGPRLHDITPSILSLFGLPVPEQMTGRDIFSPSPEAEEKALTEEEIRRLRALDYI